MRTIRRKITQFIFLLKKINVVEFISIGGGNVDIYRPLFKTYLYNNKKPIKKQPINNKCINKLVEFFGEICVDIL